MSTSNKLYDRAKDATTLWIPGAAVLYASLAGIWGLDYAVQVTGTAAAVCVFLGVVLKINTNNFAKTNTVVPDSQLAVLEQAPPGVTLSDISSGTWETGTGTPRL